MTAHGAPEYVFTLRTAEAARRARRRSALKRGAIAAALVLAVSTPGIVDSLDPGPCAHTVFC